MQGKIISLLATPMAWSITDFLNNLGDRMKDWGNALLIVIGIAALVWGGIQLVTGLMSHGKKPVNWLIVIGLIIAGGAMMLGGFGVMEKFAEVGTGTVDELGGGTWIVGLRQMIPFLK